MILAQRPITNQQLQKIEENWKSEGLEFNDEVLDNIRRYQTTLRMPVDLVKGKGYMNISCQLSATKRKSDYLLIIQSIRLKRNFLSFFIFLLAAGFLYIATFSLLSGMIGGILLATVYHFYITDKIKTFAKQYLNELILSLNR